MNADESNYLRDNVKRLRDENKELTSALMACQEELAHLNEKALLHEAGDERVKTKIKELVAEMDQMIQTVEDKERLMAIKRKIAEVVQVCIMEIY